VRLAVPARVVGVLLIFASVMCALASGSAVIAGPTAMGRWESRASMPSERTEVAGAAVGDSVYIVGGLVPSGVTGALEEYDAASNTWRARAAMPIGVHHAAMVAVGSRLFVLGGFTGNWAPVAAVWEYEPAADLWSPHAPMTVARGALAAAVAGGRIYVISGGPRPGGTYSHTNEVFIPENGR